MVFSEIIRTRRTVRLFQQKPIHEKELEEIVDAARHAPSARNIQPLEFVIVDSEKLKAEMLSCLGMGGFIQDIKAGKDPAAYAVVLVNKELKGNWTNHDCGLAVENLVLAAWEKGIGSCIIANVNKDKVRTLLKIPDGYDIDIVVPLGYPAETPVAEEMKEDTTVFRDAKGVLRVPKRHLKKILHRNGF